MSNYEILKSKSINELIKSLPDDAAQMKIHVCGSSDTLALIRKLIAACVQHLSLKPAELNDIKLAATEACTNVIKHAYKFNEKMCFDIQIATSSEVFLIEVLYHDPDFVPEKIPEPDLKQVKEGGLGVFIIKSIMDRVKYDTSCEKGSVKLQMIKLLTKK